ncbi:hypothetical protein [Veillonella magna]|uniref:Uncharacterized protein n=1 Tax=Veillonella magna TaxID=464322 RepID=A0ABS2GCM2_9FIRM|nr:hypothetical protein [Veillonella magna]MBM6823557.1 hypothetical protein [Veillonella magna]MBM6911901.1 hypothetical protein [Veillonella magna]
MKPPMNETAVHITAEESERNVIRLIASQMTLQEKEAVITRLSPRELRNNQTLMYYTAQTPAEFEKLILYYLRDHHKKAKGKHIHC